MFTLPWVHEKFTVKFTMSKVGGCVIYAAGRTVASLGVAFIISDHKSLSFKIVVDSLSAITLVIELLRHHCSLLMPF